MMSFSFKKQQLSVITEVVFGEMCRSATASLVARMVNTNLEAPIETTSAFHVD